MDKARETLTQASHKLAEQMYKAAQPQGGAQAGPSRSAAQVRSRAPTAQARRKTKA